PPPPSIYSLSLHDALPISDQLSHDLGPLGIAEIEVVGDCHRPRSDRREVAPSLCHGLLAALERIRLAIARGHVSGEGERLRSVRSEEHTSELQSRFDLVCR